MFGLTSTSLLGVCIAAAVLSVAAATLLAFRKTPDGWTLRLLHAAPLVATVLIAQGLAIMSVGLIVNNQYGFYTSWSDFLGEVGPSVPIVTKGLVPPQQGRAMVYRVPPAPSSQIRDNQVLVWLPPEYTDKAYADYHFPVVMFLPGLPGQPGATFQEFKFSSYAIGEIKRHHVPPFIAVFPTAETNSPRDTECTNIVGGPQVETWLATTVPHFVERRLRVAPQGPNWTAMGWSVGGFCAAKLLFKHPNLFGSAVSFGGYFQAVQDSSTGKLFTSQQMRNENSPMWWYQKNGLGSNQLLMVAGRQDRSSWSDTNAMIKATTGDPAASRLVFPAGGHNFQTYRVYLPAALDWSARNWGPWGNSAPNASIRPRNNAGLGNPGHRKREMVHR